MISDFIIVGIVRVRVDRESCRVWSIVSTIDLTSDRFASWSIYDRNRIVLPEIREYFTILIAMNLVHQLSSARGKYDV